MIHLLPAMKTAFDASAPLVAAFPGDGAGRRGFHVGEAYAGAPMPYVIATPVTAPRQQVYGGEGQALSAVQFAIHAQTLEAARSVVAAFVAAWDEVVPALSAGRVHYVRREGDPLPLEGPEGQGPDGEDVWAWVVTYEYGHS